MIRLAYQEFTELAELLAWQRGQHLATMAGHWVVQDLPVEYVQYLYTQLGHQQPLASLVAQANRPTIVY
jgi:hypothetical protein